MVNSSARQVGRRSSTLPDGAVALRNVANSTPGVSHFSMPSRSTKLISVAEPAAGGLVCKSRDRAGLRGTDHRSCLTPGGTPPDAQNWSSTSLGHGPRRQRWDRPEIDELRTSTLFGKRFVQPSLACFGLRLIGRHRGDVGSTAASGTERAFRTKPIRIWNAFRGSWRSSCPRRWCN